MAVAKAGQLLTRSNTPVNNDAQILPFRQLETIVDPLPELAREGARRSVSVDALLPVLYWENDENQKTVQWTVFPT